MIQPCRIHQAAADLMASRGTFHVDGARSAHCVVNQAANRSASMSGDESLPNSVTTEQRIRLTGVDDVIEGDVYQAPVEVDVADLEAAQLTAAHAGKHYQPQVQSQGGAARASLGDHLGHVFWRGSRAEVRRLPSLTWEPVSGFEPLACRLQDGCSAC